MGKLRIAFSVATLGGTALFVATTELRGYTTLGFTLGLGFRDVRVFNNFSDLAANDNTTAEPSWPGVTGAPLAIWKACSEWSSELHDNSGAGDPSQPAGLGSGGANYDCAWQGLATGVGGAGDRVHSEISGSSAGVFAYTEGPFGGPFSNGWRIRYYSSWLWDDGPSTTLAPGAYDLQGVACHEYGHALGLGHSADSSATMYMFVIGDGVPERSIESDDQDGVRSVYAVLDSGIKPHLASVALVGTTITLTGVNFAAADNEIWFTQAGPASAGTPIKALGLPSGGTSLSTTVPAGVGAGDVLVKKGGLSGAKGLSNALAFDPTACASPTSYCTAGLSTNFCAPAMSVDGIASASASSGFTLTCSGIEGQKNAMLFYGTSGRVAVPWGAGGSLLCVRAPTQRTITLDSGGTGGACDGSVALDWLAFLSANPAALGHPLQAGLVVDAQCWYRDPPASKSTNLSNAIEFTLCP